MAKAKRSPAQNLEHNTGYRIDSNVLTGAIAFVSFVLGILLLLFGINLASDKTFLASAINQIADLRPSPAMLGKIDYKVEALSSLSRSLGLWTAILSFIVFYLSLKKADLWGRVVGILKKLSGFLGGREGIGNFCFVLGASILTVFAVLLLSFSLMMHIFNVPITVYHFPVSIAISAAVSILLFKLIFKNEKWLKISVLGLSVLAIIFSWSYFFSGSFYDVGFDSLAYHQEMIIRLADGWGPYSLDAKEPSQGFFKSHAYTASKSGAICAASLYKITGNIEYGKSFNFLLIFASFFIALSALLSLAGIGGGHSLLVAFMLAFNPVSVYQSLSLYVDGQLSSLMVCLFALSAQIIIRAPFLQIVFAGVAMMIAVNTKLTGVVYSFAVASVLSAYLFFKEKFFLFFSASMIFLFSAIIGIFLIGFNPYITNHIHNGHIFYPFFCKDAEPVVSHAPPILIGKSQPEKLFVSVFSETENYYVGRNDFYTFKFPFFVSAHELTCFTNPDTRIGGFGPLFGAMAIVSLVMLAWGAFKDRKASLATFGFMLWVLLSAVIITEPWWARFVPQIWIIPIAGIVFGCTLRDKPSVYIRNFLIALTLLNIILVSSVYYVSQSVTSDSLRRQLNELKSEKGEIFVYAPFGQYAIANKLKDSGIKANEVGPGFFKQQPGSVAADFFMFSYVRK